MAASSLLQRILNKFKGAGNKRLEGPEDAGEVEEDDYAPR